MIRTIGMALALLAAAYAGPAGAQEDVKGSADHPLVGRYEGSTIKFYQVKGYEEVALIKAAFPVGGNVDVATITVPLAGKFTQIQYQGPGDRSALEVVRNYQAALEEKGFTTVFFCRMKDCGASAQFWNAARLGISVQSQWDTNTYALMRLERPEGNVWAGVFAIETKASSNQPLRAHVALNVVEEKPMDVKKVSILEASALKSAIDATGRVAVYGLYFGVDKAELEPASEPQLTEIARLMKDNPALSVLVVGHTDATGALDHNRGLSERRAAAVVSALTGTHGIAANRLFAVGVGPASPVATNRTDEGRAKNRRVEIVELPGAP